MALSLSVVLMGVSAERSTAGVNVGVSVEDGKLTGFYLAVKEYYKVPEREIVVVRERHIPDEEMPVVFFIARKANVPPSSIIAMRLKGNSWMEITLRFGLDPEIYYVPVGREISGPPYGKAYGHFKHGHKHKKGGPPWRRGEENEGRYRASLGDDDIVNFVNLKFMSEHYRLQPEDVIDMRSRGRNFVSINDDIKRHRKPAKYKDGVTETAKRSDRDGEQEEGGNGRKKEKGHGRWK